MRTSRREMPISSASRRISALLAAPSTAGAMTLTLRTPSTTSSTRSTADRGVRRTAKRTAGNVNGSEGAPQEAEDDQDDEPRPVDHPGRWKDAANRRQDRLGRLDQEGGDLVPSSGIDPRHDHAPEHEQPERDEQELDEIDQERHASSLPVERGEAGRGPSVAARRVLVIVVVRTLAEQGAPDPHHRRALLHRDLEVVGHAHRQRGPKLTTARADPFRGLTERPEGGSCLLRALDEP